MTSCNKGRVSTHFFDVVFESLNNRHIIVTEEGEGPKGVDLSES